MIDVVFYEAFQEEEAAIKQFLPKNVKARFTKKTIQECSDETPPAKLISVRTQSRIPADWAKSVSGVLTRSRGYDHLLLFRREAKADIPCGYLGDYCARAVAEQAILMMMALLRRLTKQINSFSSFKRDGLTGKECRDKKVFVAGVGHIGSEVVDVARGMRMTVKGFDIEKRIDSLEYVSLPEGVGWADIVFCALPLTEKTKGLFNYQALQSAKPGSVFINIARGEISPVEDLKKLLDQEILGGIGLDVYPEEAELANNLRAGKANEEPMGQAILELAQNERVIFTPHNAFNTAEALEKKALLSVDAIACYMKNGKFPSPVPA